jgi:G protein-coupled receptor 125
MNCINGGHLHRFIILFLIFIGILLWILERGLGFLKKNTICGTVNCADIIVYVFFSRVSRRVEVSWRRVLIVFHLRKPTPRTTSVSYNVGWILHRITFLAISVKYLCSGSDIYLQNAKMRENSSVDGKKKLVNSGVTLTLTVVVLLCVLEYSVVRGKTEFLKTNADLQATSLCPAACTCSEQKLKISQGSVEQELNPSNHKEATENLNVNSKTKPEILKSGIKVQCQNPAFIVSLKKLNLQSLLVENVVQYDLSGNSLTRLSGEDFASGNYLMLQKLILKNNQIEEIAADTFSTLKNLKYLDLSNNFLTNFSSAIIENLMSLDRVKLNGNPIKCNCHLSGLLTYASSRNIRLQGTCLEPPRLKDRSLTRLVVEELACPPEDPVGVEIRPNTNQLVFEGDPLKLSCKFKAGRAVAPNWLHRNANNQTATVSPGGAVELTTSSRGTDQGTETESQLLIRHLLPRHGGMWACSWGGRTASVEVTVLSLTTPTCSSQISASNKGRYSWPRTMANLKIVLPCQANPNLQAFRLCGALGHWEEPDLNSCFYLSEVTKVLEQFAKTNLTFSKTSALESARRLKSYLTDVISLTDPHEAIFVTQTLHNYLEASGKHPELLPIIMDIYSILITQDPQLLADSRHGLVGVLQQAPLKTPEFEYRSSSLVIEKCGIIGKSLSAGTCTWRRTSETGSSKPDTKTKARSPYKASCGQNSTGTGTMEASVRVPLISEGAFSEQSIVLSLVLSTNAFVSAKTKPLATSVLGITSGPVSNLINRTTPFVMTIRLSRAIGTSDRLVGARWNHYTDQWSPEQCQTLKSSGLMSEGDSVTFQCCCGFGFFAAFTTQDDEDEQDVIEQVTTRGGSGNIPGSTYYPGQLHLLPSPVYVGSVIGLLCHLTACLCYLIHRRRLKMTQPTRHALINTWISVALLMVAFTLGVRPVLGKLPCQITGLLLHYLTLSSLLWMVVNASSLYKHITKSSRTDPETDSSLMEEAMAVGHDSPPKPALRFYLIGWGIPLIVVVCCETVENALKYL